MDCEALLDFGANTCFMDREFAKEQGIPLVEKSNTDKNCRGYCDGGPLASGDARYETHPIEVTLKDHVSKIAFNIIQCSSIPIVIGLPWLELHNPSID